MGFQVVVGIPDDDEQSFAGATAWAAAAFQESLSTFAGAESATILDNSGHTKSVAAQAGVARGELSFLCQPVPWVYDERHLCSPVLVLFDSGHRLTAFSSLPETDALPQLPRCSSHQAPSPQPGRQTAVPSSQVERGAYRAKGGCRARSLLYDCLAERPTVSSLSAASVSWPPDEVNTEPKICLGCVLGVLARIKHKHSNDLSIHAEQNRDFPHPGERGRSTNRIR